MPHPRSKGSTGYPGRGQGHGPLPHDELPGHRLPLGHGHRRLRDAALRVPLPGPVRRDDQLVTSTGDCRSSIMQAHLGVAVGHRRARQAVLRRRPTAMSPVNYVKLDRAADGRRHEPDHQRDEARRLLRDARARCSSPTTRSRAPATSGRSARRSSGPSRWTSSRWSGATGRRPIGRSSRPPICRRSARSASQIPFNAAGKKWVRFAAWDVATNGAFVQPVRLTQATTTTAGRNSRRSVGSAGP